ncbi:MAG: type IV pilus biogenesis/stability protein PilW [Rhodocyclaceae bacterium]|nr:type IV pilus biogenesis/stability protein PilW [Rhodocyclaceae bacterium]MBX3669093.1 type IV pilus biogenesis/stability protein PilW [Rhodocyclaceae bacterium]
MIKKICLVALLLTGCSQMGVRPEGSGDTVASTTPTFHPTEESKTGTPRMRAQAHAELGLKYFDQGNLAVALEEARIAQAFDADYAPGYRLMALVQMGLRERPQALTSFQTAERLAPNDPDINNDFGFFLCQEGRETDGLQRLMTAIKNPLYRTPSRAWHNAGLCYLRLRDDKAAADAFRQALAMDPANLAAMFLLSEINYRAQDYFEARRFLSELHRRMQPNAETLWLGLRIERKAGDREAEASFATQLRRNFAGSPQYQALMQGKFE